jgi:hypothetical protein
MLQRLCLITEIIYLRNIRKDLKDRGNSIDLFDNRAWILARRVHGNLPIQGTAPPQQLLLPINHIQRSYDYNFCTFVSDIYSFYLTLV